MLQEQSLSIRLGLLILAARILIGAWQDEEGTPSVLVLDYTLLRRFLGYISI
jgi:hypothetical protein